MPACLAGSPQAAIIVQALKNYGAIIGDNSYAGELVGTPDARWNDADLACVNQIPLSVLEPVNVSSLMLNYQSAQTSH